MLGKVTAASTVINMNKIRGKQDILMFPSAPFECNLRFYPLVSWSCVLSDTYLTLVWSRTGRTSYRWPVAAADLPGTCSGRWTERFEKAWIWSSVSCIWTCCTHPSFLLIQNRSCRLPNSVGSLSGWGTKTYKVTEIHMNFAQNIPHEGVLTYECVCYQSLALH